MSETKLPDTSQRPDHIYFEGNVVSYDMEANGNKATLGIIQPGFKGEFSADEGGEEITLQDDIDDAGLSIEVVGADGNIEQSRVLTKKGDSISALGGTTLKVTTTGAPATYICTYPGKPAVN